MLNEYLHRGTKDLQVCQLFKPCPGDFGGNTHRDTRWHLVRSFGGPFHSKITWAGTGLIKGCNRRVFLLFVQWNGVHIAEVSGVCNLIQFRRDCKDWKYNDLKLKWCRQTIWLWVKTGQQNSTSRLIKSGCLLICFTFVTKSPGWDHCWCPCVSKMRWVNPVSGLLKKNNNRFLVLHPHATWN